MRTLTAVLRPIASTMRFAHLTELSLPPCAARRLWARTRSSSIPQHLHGSQRRLQCRTRLGERFSDLFLLLSGVELGRNGARGRQKDDSGESCFKWREHGRSNLKLDGNRGPAMLRKKSTGGSRVIEIGGAKEAPSRAGWLPPDAKGPRAPRFFFWAGFFFLRRFLGAGFVDDGVEARRSPRRSAESCTDGGTSASAAMVTQHTSTRRI